MMSRATKWKISRFLKKSRKIRKIVFFQIFEFWPFSDQNGGRVKNGPLAILWEGRARFPAASKSEPDFVRDAPLKSHHGETWLSCFPSRNSVGSLNPLCNIVDAGVRAIGMTIPLGSNVHVGLAGPMGWITALSLIKTPTARRRGVWAGEERCRTGIRQPCAGNKFINSNFILFFCVSKWQRINASYSIMHYVIMHHVISSTKILWYICIV